MKYMFIVQGEGRGHQTQALALKELIEEAGHEICCVLVGHNKKKGSIPEFFKNAFKCRVIETASPNFVFDKEQGVNLRKTMFKSITSFGRFVITFLRIGRRIAKHNPDIIVNFYEPIYGLYRLFGGAKNKQSFAIGHQFMFLHPNYVANLANEKKIPIWLAKQYTRLVGCKSIKLALSITEEVPINEVIVVPPILRKQLFDLYPENGDYVLVYSLGRGHGKSFLKGASSTTKFEVFTEKFWPSVLDTLEFGNITFNQLSGEKFLQYMKNCDMVVCTAGFETASEAAYLGKKILVIPTQNHDEQYFNAWDFQLAGLAKMRFNFDNISRFEVETNPKSTERFRKWVNSYKAKFKEALNI